RSHGHAGGEDLQVLDVADAGVLERLLRQARDHDRHVLQVLLTLLRRDDDVVDGGRAVLAVLGRSGAGEAEGDSAYDGRRHGSAKKVGKAHGRSPTWPGAPE